MNNNDKMYCHMKS